VLTYQLFSSTLLSEYCWRMGGLHTATATETAEIYFYWVWNQCFAAESSAYILYLLLKLNRNIIISGI